MRGQINSDSCAYLQRANGPRMCCGSEPHQAPNGSALGACLAVTTYQHMAITLLAPGECLRGWSWGAWPWGATPPVHALRVSESLLPRAECDAAVCIPVHYQIMNMALPHSETFLLTKCCAYSELSTARFC